MKQACGWWFPSHEEHMVEWITKHKDRLDDRLAYQGKKIRAFLGQVKSFRRVVDVGAHVGLWAHYFAKRFEHVEAFEPVAEHRACFERNVDMSKATLWAMALGDQEGRVSMNVPNTSSGGTTVSGAGDIPLRRLDDVLADVSDVDAMKLDCEGYELNILKGAEKLIERCRPTIIVEQKPGMAQRFGLTQVGAVEFLRARGYRVVSEIGGDYILVRP